MYYKIILAIVACVTFNGAKCVDIASNCSHNDTRCLQKREEMHWCTDEGCSTCTDHNCIITCKGFSCGMCPKGDCCNGLNCNACYNDSCCATESCNYCIRTCKQACGNYTLCEKLCIPQCQNSDRTIFVVPSTSNSNQATVYIRGVPYKGDLTSRPISSHDKTAVVLVDGIDNIAMVLSLRREACNGKECDNKCSGQHCGHDCMKECQSKCSKDCSGSCQRKCSQTTPLKEFNYYNTLTPGCCHVVHPRICHNSPIYGQSYCYKRSHRECSALCTSKFIHIGPHREKFVQHYHCYYILVHPYVYCGNYVIQNCDSCYVCNGNYNPYECVKSSLCPSTCKDNFLPFKQTTQKQESTRPPTSVRNHIPNPFLGPFRYSYFYPNQLFPQHFG